MKDFADRYFEQVIEVLEGFDYPLMVIPYATEDVAQSMSGTIAKCILLGISPRMCAVIIWAATMTLQIIPGAERATKH